MGQELNDPYIGVEVAGLKPISFFHKPLRLDKLRQSTLCLGVISLIYKSLVSGTNFLTEVIIDRACAIEEFKLFFLTLSTLLFVIDVQASLITRPYMIHSPHLKEEENLYYSGSTLIH